MSTYDPQVWQSALEDGDAQAIARCVEEGADPDALLPGLSLTPLMLACSRGQASSVRTLLELGANVDLPRHETGITPLMASVHGAQAAIVGILCEHGAQVDLLDQQGFTALGLAVASQHTAIVEILLSHQANPSLHGATNKTPLAQACHQGDRHLVAMLLGAGAPADPPSRHGQDSALIEAADAGHVDIVELLLDNNAKIDQRDFNANTPLMLAASMGHLNVVRSLLERGANPNCTNKPGQTAFHCALDAGNEAGEAIAMALLHSLRIEQPNKKGQTPLFSCIQSGHYRLAQYLIERGANIRHADRKSATPLHWAARWGDPGMVRMLLEKGADPGVVDDKGRTALHIACSHGHLDSAKLLLAHGQMDMVNRFGETPLMMAALQGESAVAVMLMDRGANRQTRSDNGSLQHCAAIGGAHDLMALLVSMDGADESFNACGRAPLHEAAAQNHQRVGVALVRGGADLTQCTRDGLGVNDLATPEFLRACHEALANRQRKALQSSTPYAASGPGRARL